MGEITQRREVWDRRAGHGQFVGRLDRSSDNFDFLLAPKRFGPYAKPLERGLLLSFHPATARVKELWNMAAILVVDDDDVSRHIVRRMLERAGHQVEEAADGEAAITALEGGLRPDCMVLDLMMPRLSGVDVLRRLRNDARWQDVPVVLMTALDQGSEVEAARQMGFRRHFLKAYWHAGDLVSAIEHTITPATTTPSVAAAVTAAN